MRQYLDLLQNVLEYGKEKTDPQGIGNRAIFAQNFRWDMANGFPLLTTKRLAFRFIVYELLWFLRGETKVRFLQDNGVTIWDEWATKELTTDLYGRELGDLGPTYGYQWRHWQTPDGREIDQIAQLVKDLKTNPDSRRLKVVAWNPADIDKVFVAPCHGDFKCFVAAGKLSISLWQRSADSFLGVPYNIASYALLLLMLAQVSGLSPGELVIQFVDFHLYNNHVEQAQLQLAREPRILPRVEINPHVVNIFDFQYEDFKLIRYDPHPAIKAGVGI
jgi:thymidylate synthase